MTVNSWRSYLTLQIQRLPSCGTRRRDGQREVLLDRLPQLQMPTLILWRIEDRLLPYTQAREVSALVQDGSLELISNCGHLPPVERFKRFVSTLREFLSKHPPNV